jgi:putative transcriptional regulator
MPGRHREATASCLPQLIGQRIRQFRAERGWSQRDLAARLLISASRLAKYESGVHEPPLRTLIRMARVFGAPVDALLAESPAERPVGDTGLLQRLRRIETLGPAEREAAMALLDVLLGFQQLTAGRPR